MQFNQRTGKLKHTRTSEAIGAVIRSKSYFAERAAIFNLNVRCHECRILQRSVMNFRELSRREKLEYALAELGWSNLHGFLVSCLRHQPEFLGAGSRLVNGLGVPFRNVMVTQA